jgi:methyl-accepting chemotaxis protein
MSKSLRFQTLALLIASIVLVLSIALAWLHFLSGNLQEYRDLIDGPLQSSYLADEANLQFKVQVQEWKSILLRGKPPADRDELWDKFENQERRVQDALKRLSVLNGIDPAVKARIDKLSEEHRTLGSAYRKGRDAFIVANTDSVAGDQAVVGIDRTFTQQMNQLVIDLRNQSNTLSKDISADASQTILTGTLAILVSTLFLGILTLLSSRRFRRLIG